ncbi:MAG: demethylmenaquinone methyltransferase [Negativicutes bacterium]|nr:demethylmenaquinone methyltransferase [Negativicutes bacterium]
MNKSASWNKEEFVHNLFCTIAHRYDLLNTLLSFNRDRYWRRFAIGQTGLAAGQTGLDVCCGTGLMSIGLAKRLGPEGRVVGLDFCRSMLDIAVTNIAKTPYGANIELIEGNAMALPFADDSFDCATIGFALRNVPDIRAVISEMRRVVRPGGRVVSLDLAKPGAPGFKQLYYLYFEQILPILGKLGIGRDGPYQWLPESLRRFPHQTEICAYFSEVGLKDAAYHELTGGIVAVHVGRK